MVGEIPRNHFTDNFFHPWYEAYPFTCKSAYTKGYALNRILTTGIANQLINSGDAVLVIYYTYYEIKNLLRRIFTHALGKHADNQ